MPGAIHAPRAETGLPVVLAVDPGSRKCGVAVVDGSLRICERRVVDAAVLVECVRDLLRRHPVTHLVVGDRTTSGRAAALLAGVAGCLPVIAVDEHLSSLEARGRYFREHPPRGLCRLIPLGLQVPPCPVDDYVAVILAERFLSTRA